MEPDHIDFLDEKDKVIPDLPVKKIRKTSRVLFSLLAIVAVIIIVFGISVLSSGEQLSKAFGNLSLWGQIKHLASSDDRPLNGEADDRINVLLLGIGGKDHDGPQLTDTVIVASIKPSTKQLAMISLPRDLSVPLPGYGWRKINNANAFGEVNETGSGPATTAKVVEEVLGIPIHYYIRIDFDGFQKIVDDLGGVTVDVARVLDDPFYPIKGKEMATTTERYEHLYVEPGRQNMDGELALKFVRSRQGKGIEGSDFARSERQQKVLFAVKERLLSFGVLTNPHTINEITDTITEHFVTDVQAWEMLRLFQMAKDIEQEKIINYVFDDSADGLLHGAITAEGAYILQPKSGNFFEMQMVAKDIFNPEAPSRQAPLRVDVRNGTKVEGLATKKAQVLRQKGYNIVDLGNAPTQDYERSVLYVLKATPAQQNQVDAVAALLNVNVAHILPPWLTTTSTPSVVSSYADVVVILGQDQNN